MQKLPRLGQNVQSVHWLSGSRLWVRCDQSNLRNRRKPLGGLYLRSINTRLQFSSFSPHCEPIVKQHLTPKQVARAIGVSESSLKRWCDRGLLPVEKTAGGHRRLPIGGVLGFLRDQGHTVIEPEVLGLPTSLGRTDWTLDRARARFVEGLIEGDEEVCRQILLDLYLGQHDLPTICDKVLASAFHQIGEMWECGNAAIYKERRACGMALRLMHELRTLLQVAKPDVPRAIGFSMSGDNYLLALSMCELILRDGGWDAASIGHSLPVGTVLRAIDEIKPSLVWLSASHIVNEQTFVDSMQQVYKRVEEHQAVLAIGGRALSEDLRRRFSYTVHCDDMQSFVNYSKTLLRSLKN